MHRYHLRITIVEQILVFLLIWKCSWFFLFKNALHSRLYSSYWSYWTSWQNWCCNFILYRRRFCPLLWSQAACPFKPGIFMHFLNLSHSKQAFKFCSSYEIPGLLLEDKVLEKISNIIRYKWWFDVIIVLHQLLISVTSCLLVFVSFHRLVIVHRS